VDNRFFEKPILNSPYTYPSRHWELDSTGQPTQKISEARRQVRLITPIPKPRKRTSAATQQRFDEVGLGQSGQLYDPTPVIDSLRRQVDKWRQIPNPNDWKVTAETARLIQYWRTHNFSGVRPFFCQIEAVETVIWLTEVAPTMGKAGESFLEHLANANNEANPELMRLALKLATGAGKTTVMAMLIAWQTINAVRHPKINKFSKGFLIVAPGLTIRDRLRVLQPNDPDSYFKSRELVPTEFKTEIEKAKIVITNYHAFKLRERVDLSKGGRALLQGRGEALNTLETEGQMLQRVMPELMGLKDILVINDEAHHCYRAKPEHADELEDLKGEEKEEAQKNNDAARLWISGLEIVKRNIGVNRVVDLSATPFFLSGSGYAEGTLFPWTMSDFSLMDAIECGIVKLPRVPVVDNIPGAEVPIFRELWTHIREQMPKKGRKDSSGFDPKKLPIQLQTALEALYGHYAKTFEKWEDAKITVPPCFIVVCNNTTTSKLVYDYISGFHRKGKDEAETFVPGALELFRNFDEFGNPYPRPRTLLIDSEQLESGEALQANFRDIASAEIESFRREIIERTGDARQAESITDQDLLREVMNTVGKQNRLGESIRCVVSVSMLTEGWDTNTVTHVLGVRAFGTQLLCEQVIGRALRRQSYELNDEGVFNVEYADVLGIPFDFTAKPVVSIPQSPRETIHVKAVRPERDSLEIRFPRVVGYRVQLPDEKIGANFAEDSVFNLTPEHIGPAVTKNEGIVGEGVDLNLIHTKDYRTSTILFHLTKHLLYEHFRDDNQEPKLHLFGQLKAICKQWMDNYFHCSGGTYPAQLLYLQNLDLAASRIASAIFQTYSKENAVFVTLDSYNPFGTTHEVNFQTSKLTRYQPDPRKCPINWIVTDSSWEAEFCRVAESHPKVIRYVKNHSLGFEVPYRFKAEQRRYRPDFIVVLDDGNGSDDPLYLVVEVKGYRGEDAVEKKATMDTYWIPGVNRLKSFGRWAFAEFTDVFAMESDFAKKVESEFSMIVKSAVRGGTNNG
jgi:type III restriction enzyme